MTTLPVTTLAEACERIGWYAQRWQIEVIHKVLKSSCQIEQRHLETAARLEVAVTTTHVVAGILPAVEPSVSRGGKSVIIANGCRFSQAMGKFARPFRAAGETSDATFTDRHLQSDPCQPV